MDDKRQKALDFIRSKNDSSLLKKEGYSSPLDQDVMKVKGDPSSFDMTEPRTKIANTTQKIDTKGIQKIGNAADVMKANADKIAKMKALRSIGSKIPGLGAITAGIGSMMGSDDASASDVMGAIAEEAPGDLPIVGSIYDAIKSEPAGPDQGSFDDRLQKGQLTKEELELLKKQMSQGL